MTKTNVIDEKIKPLCTFPHEEEAYRAICERFGSFHNFRVAVRNEMYDYRKRHVGTGLDGGVLLEQVMRGMIPPSAIGFAYYHFNR